MTEDEKVEQLVAQRIHERSQGWGKKGGDTCVKKYGKEYMREIARKGGLNNKGKVKVKKK